MLPAPKASFYRVGRTAPYSHNHNAAASGLIGCSLRIRTLVSGANTQRPTTRRRSKNLRAGPGEVDQPSRPPEGK